MTRLTIRSLLSVLFLLILSATAQGQFALNLYGDDTVCANSDYTYQITPYPRPVPDTLSYNFYITRGYISLHVSTDEKRVTWGTPGTGYVVAVARKPNGDTVDIDSIKVAIMPSPKPIIKFPMVVTCEPLNDPDEFNPPGKFDSSISVSICAYTTVTYTAQGSPTSTYEWTILGGSPTTATGQNCTITWGAPGPAKILLKETTNQGCVGISEFVIDLVESPQTHFVALPDTNTRTLTICKGSEVIFLDKTKFDPKVPIVSWRWDFGDGTYSNEKGSLSAPVTHKYNVPGNYTVRLTTINRCGCSNEETLEVIVDPDPGVRIVCPSVVCYGADYMYHVDASCTGGSWTVIGGTVLTSSATTITIRWNSVDPNGYGYIIYDPGGCTGYCPHKVATKVPVVRNLATIEGHNYLCFDKQYLYTLPQWPTTKYNWSLSNANAVLQPTDQPNEVVLTPKVMGGSVTLTCTYFNTLLGCSGIATKVIQLPGEVTFVDSVWDYCIGIEKLFTIDGPNKFSGQWQLIKPDNSIVTSSGAGLNAVLDQVGTYLLSVKGNFCSPEPKEVRVIGKPEPPELIEGPHQICKGIPEQYRAANADADHVFNWTITGGSLLNPNVGESIEVVLNTASPYSFILTAQRQTKAKPYCLSDPTTFFINQPIVENDIFGSDSVCPNTIYQYSADYMDAEYYEWSIFPETLGSVDKGQGTRIIKVLWNKASGPAKLICRVAKCYDAYTYDTLDVYIRNLSMDLTVSEDTVCANAGATLTVDNATSQVRWYSAISDYKTDPGINWTTMTFDQPITTWTKYYLSASVDTLWGCPVHLEDYDSVIVTPAPVVSVWPPILWGDCNTLPNVVVTASWDRNGIIPDSFKWYNPNNVLVSLDTFYNITDTGTYKLIVTGGFGCSRTYEIKSKWRPCSNYPGGGTSSPGVNCLGKIATLRVDSIKNCSQSSYQRIVMKAGNTSPGTFSHGVWRIADSLLELVSSNDTMATYKVLKAGMHYISYTAWFSDGSSGLCSSTADTVVTIPFVAMFEVRGLCTETAGKRNIEFIDKSTSIPGYPIRWRKFMQRRKNSVGYDTLYNGPNGYYTGPTINDTNVIVLHQLMVSTDSHQCRVSAYPIGSIGKLPNADFTAAKNPACVKDAPVQFTNLSSPTGNMNWNWSFGDNAGNTQKDPYRVYDAVGPYTVTLMITDMFGCKDTISHNLVIVTDDLDGEVTITPDFPCDNTIATATYADKGLSPANWYEWYDKNAKKIGGGNSSSPTWDLYQSGYYYALAKDQYDCLLHAQGDTVLFIKAPKAEIWGSGSQCQDIPFALSGYAGQVSGLTYNWYKDNMLISGANDAELKQTISTPGTYYYRVETVSPKPGGGSCSDLSDSFKVVVHGTPNPPTISFTVRDCNNYRVELDIDTPRPGIYNWSHGDTGSINRMVYHGGPFQVIYTDTNGCKNKGQVHVPRDLREYLWIFPTGCYSLCSTKANIITGPIIPFKPWRYHNNGIVRASGTGVKPVDQNITPWGAGAIQLYLMNDWCDIWSDTMHVSYGCLPYGGGTTGSGFKYSTGFNSLAAAPAMLQLVPNPAANSTMVSYKYGGGDIPAYIELYDVLGRVLYGRQLPTISGNFHIDLQHFVPGTYRVILRQGGVILKDSQLSVTK